MRRGCKIIYTYEKNGYRGCRFTCNKDGRFIDKVYHHINYRGPILCWVKLKGNINPSRVPRDSIIEDVC